MSRAATHPAGRGQRRRRRADPAGAQAEPHRQRRRRGRATGRRPWTYLFGDAAATRGATPPTCPRSSCSTSSCPRWAGWRSCGGSAGQTRAPRLLPVVILTSSNEESDIVAQLRPGRQQLHPQARGLHAVHGGGRAAGPLLAGAERGPAVGGVGRVGTPA